MHPLCQNCINPLSFDPLRLSAERKHTLQIVKKQQNGHTACLLLSAARLKAGGTERRILVCSTRRRLWEAIHLAGNVIHIERQTPLPISSMQIRGIVKLRQNRVGLTEMSGLG